MRKVDRKKHGFTLAELAVVLAITTIVATMVVTFTTLVSNRHEIAQAKLDALNDIKVAEAMIEAWLAENTLTFDEHGNAQEITYAEGILTVGEKQHTLDRVTNISFAKQGTDNIIYFCTVTYELPDKVEYYTFCVNAQKVEGGS